MFTLSDYVGVHKDSPDWTPERQNNALILIERCAGLQADLEAAGINFPVNPRTGTTISGETYGGFRPQSCPIGAPDSSHKAGKAVDRFDPHGDIDTYLLDHPELLEKHDIYIEAPASTIGWSHWGIKLQDSDAPKSGHRIFIP